MEKSYITFKSVIFKDFMWFKLKVEHQHSTRSKVGMAYDTDKDSGFSKWPSQGLEATASEEGLPACACAPPTEKITHPPILGTCI